MKFISYAEAKRDALASILLFILIILLHLLSGSTPNLWDTNNTISVFITVAATMLGFMLTAFSILIAFPKEGKLKNLVHHNNFPLTYQYFVGALIILLLLLVISVYSTLIPVEWRVWYYYLILFFMIYSFISIFRVIRLLGILAELTLPNNK